MTSNELSRLLKAERAARPPAGALDAGLSRLVSALGNHATPLPVASGPLRVWLSALPQWVGIGFLIGATGAGIASHASSPPAPASGRPSAAVKAPALTPSYTAPQAPTAPPSSAAPIVNLAPAPRMASQSAATAPSTAASSPPHFDQELRLITAAKRELDGGRAHLALAWLDEHRARFPAGVFAIDREALSILARCRQRRQPELAQSFARNYPAAPMTAQLIERCADSAKNFSEPTNAQPAPEEPTQ